MKIREILICLVLITLLILIAMSIVYHMAASICDKSEILPFRYESQGLLGTLTKIPTTSQNADGYARLCIRTGNPEFFKLSENINYILTKQAEK